jgi:hypothetical protein
MSGDLGLSFGTSSPNSWSMRSCCGRLVAGSASGSLLEDVEGRERGGVVGIVRGCSGCCFLGLVDDDFRGFVMRECFW